MEDSKIYLYLFIALAFVAIVFLIGYFFLRYVFSIKRQLWTQKQALHLLIRMAEKSGAITSNEAGDIVKASNIEDQYLK